MLVELAQDWFGRHPLYDERGQPIGVPEWSFPGRGRVQRQLRQATRLMDVAERRPRPRAVPAQAGRSGPLDWRTARPWPKRALGYVELYGAYTETEARYRVDHLLALWETLDDEDQAGSSASTPP